MYTLAQFKKSTIFRIQKTNELIFTSTTLTRDQGGFPEAHLETVSSHSSKVPGEKITRVLV